MKRPPTPRPPLTAPAGRPECARHPRVSGGLASAASLSPRGGINSPWRISVATLTTIVDPGAYRGNPRHNFRYVYGLLSRPSPCVKPRVAPSMVPCGMTVPSHDLQEPLQTASSCCYLSADVSRPYRVIVTPHMCLCGLAPGGSLVLALCRVVASAAGLDSTRSSACRTEVKVMLTGAERSRMVGNA